MTEPATPAVAEAGADHILGQIREHGGRVTQSRRMVVEAILASPDHHVTAAGLVDAMRQVDPEFQESTVYRVLDRLTELGVVQPVQLDASATVFHLAHRVHHHLLCVECGSVTEADADLLDEVARQVARTTGFMLRTDAATTLRGVCEDCR